MKLAVVRDCFDTQLRPLLEALQLAALFDTIFARRSAPNPLVFEAACQQLGIEPAEAIHVGDERK